MMGTNLPCFSEVSIFETVTRAFSILGIICGAKFFGLSTRLDQTTLSSARNEQSSL